MIRDSSREVNPFFYDDDVDYESNKTKWNSNNDLPIEMNYLISFDVEHDPGMCKFVERIAEVSTVKGDAVSIEMNIQYRKDGEHIINAIINGASAGKFASKEIYQRIISSKLAIFHNSTDGGVKFVYPIAGRGFHEMILSESEKEEINKEKDRIKKKIRKFALENRTELSGLLGEFDDKYEVELTVFDRFVNNSIPLSINLKDKSVEVPLDNWGSGTQNRTQIMMSILNANRIRNQMDDENRVTPIIIIEEPECFLHPSAQADFGKVIRNLANDLRIQIIITTHSPYMLCHKSPNSNILLDRKVFRGKPKGTEVIGISTEKWMEPFANILGLSDESIGPWHDAVSAGKNKAILVEGVIDKEYLDHIGSKKIKGFSIPSDVDIIPYGGKDALKNAIMLKFIIDKFDSVLITFDLDCKSELDRIMKTLGLVEDQDYHAVGIKNPGCDCIEGLVPNTVISGVFGENPDLVMKLSSTNAQDRKKAKEELKKKILFSFKTKDLDVESLKNFKSLFQVIKRKFDA